MHRLEDLEKHQSEDPFHVCDFLGYFYIISYLEKGQNKANFLFELLGLTDMNLREGLKTLFKIMISLFMAHGDYVVT